MENPHNPDETPFQPICPHCKREPIVVQGSIVNLGGLPVMIVCCSGCRKVVSTTALPLPPNFGVRPQQPESSLILPGREM